MEKLTKKEKKEQRKFEWQEQLKRQQQKEMLKKVGIWGGIAFATLLGIVVLLRASSSSGPASNLVVPPINDKDIVVGKANAKVSIIEYADFQCPACASYHPTLKRLLSEYDGKVKLVFRNFPLSQIHKNARVSAQAAYAAYKQDKFEEMYDLLYQNQNSWATSPKPASIYEGYAKRIGLDLDKFNEDMESDEARRFIAEQENAAINAGLNSTPTFFIDGVQIANPQGYEDFKKIIEENLNK